MAPPVKISPDFSMSSGKTLTHAEAFKFPSGANTYQTTTGTVTINAGGRFSTFDQDGTLRVEKLEVGGSPIVTRAELEQQAEHAWHRAAWSGAAQGTAFALLCFYAVRTWITWARRRLWLSKQEGRSGAAGPYREIGRHPRPPAPERAKG